MKRIEIIFAIIFQPYNHFFQPTFHFFHTQNLTFQHLNTSKVGEERNTLSCDRGNEKNWVRSVNLFFEFKFMSKDGDVQIKNVNQTYLLNC